MKLFTILFFLALTILFQGNAFSQIPNAGFENWTNEDPDNWLTLDFFTFNAVTQSADARSGSSARMEIIDVGGGSGYFPYLYAAFPVSGKPGSLTGYYKFFPQTDKNGLDIVVGMYSSANGLVGVGGFTNFNSVSTFTQFVAAIEYFSEEFSPDTATITFLVTDTSGAEIVGIGSYALIDDLLGREIKKLVSDNYPVGNYSVDFSADNLSGGVYIAKMNAGKYSKAIKMTLLK